VEPVEAERRAGGRIQRMSVVGLPHHDEFRELHDAYGFFPVYMIGRTAPAGGGPRFAHALTALFPYGLVASAFRRASERGDVDDLRRSYVEAVAEVGERLYGPPGDAPELAELLEALVAAADLADRPLAAAWADLPVPEAVGARVERAVTVLREHRGNAHVSVLTAHGLTGPDGLLLTGLWRETDDVEAGAKFLGWRDDDLAAAWERLELTGRVDGRRGLTSDGREERQAIEDLTVALAARRWEAVAPADRARTVELVESASTARD
jgi:hypothetical protein